MAFELPLRDPMVQFTVLVTAALIVLLCFKRIHLPGLTGLLAIGMIIGPGGVNLLPREPLVNLLGELGLLYIMFQAGLEIDLEIVKEHRKETASFGLLAFSCSLTPAVGAGLLLGYPLLGALLLGAMISSHTLLGYPILKRLGLLHRRAVVTAIGGTLVTDTLALMLLAISIRLVEVDQITPAGLRRGLVPILLLAVLAAISLRAVPRLSRSFVSAGWVTQAEKALYVLAVLMLLSSAAEFIGTEQILGAFLAGLCLNRVLEEKEDLREHVEFVGRMLFIPFFFISTGMLLELGILFGQPSVWMFSALLFLLVLAGKAAALWIIGMWQGYAGIDRALIASLTVPQAAATLAVATIAHEAALFEKTVVDAVIILIFITGMLGPMITLYVGKKVMDDSNGERLPRHGGERDKETGPFLPD